METSNRPRLFINRRTPIVTYALAAVNIIAFLADIAAEYLLGYPLLTLLGAKINALILAGEWWRFVTPLFLHSGVSHIFFNMAALLIWGRQLEALLGKARFLAVYFAAGIMGTAASFAFSQSISVGASGAIFGLFGALLFFRREHRDVFNAVFGAQVLVIIGINIVNGFVVSNIDNFGHLGGLLGGFAACGATGFYGQRQKAIVRAGCLAGYVLLTAAMIFFRVYGY